MYFWRVYAIKLDRSYICCHFSITYILNILGAVLNFSTWLTLLVLDLVLYFCEPFLSIIMSLLCSFSLLVSRGVALLLYLGFFNSILVFGYFSFFGVTVKFLLMVGRKSDRFFSGFTGWSSSGYISTIDVIRGSSLVTVFNWNSLLIWDISWFSPLSFSWTISLIGTLGGTVGGLDFLNILARVPNASL